ncbi:MAG: hypothetical protein Q8912_14035 [Bacillota bacterium]|nr:hypothetical protein [Bacillota bacterium]
MIYRLILFLIIVIILLSSAGIGSGLGSYMTFSINQLKQVQQNNSLLLDK